MRILALVLLLAFTPAQAQRSDWARPFEAHRVIGNLYYVGTYDLAVYLVTSDEGHFLINTGMEDSTAQIRSGVESLGFQLEDVKVLLTMQAHWDHTAALAEIKRLTGAEMWATADDAPVLKDGGFSDPHFGGKQTFKPVEVERILRDGETISLGDAKLKVVETPGHTRGSVSYTMTVRENGRDYNVGIINMNSINPGKRFQTDPTYPEIISDFEQTFSVQKKLPVDVYVSAHASQYDLHNKFKPGDPYSPGRFVDPGGYLRKVQSYEDAYRKYLRSEAP